MRRRFTGQGSGGLLRLRPRRLASRSTGEPAMGADIDQEPLALSTEGHSPVSVTARDGSRRSFSIVGVLALLHRFFEARGRRLVSVAMLRRLLGAGGVPVRNS